LATAHKSGLTALDQRLCLTFNKKLPALPISGRKGSLESIPLVDAINVCLPYCSRCNDVLVGPPPAGWSQSFDVVQKQRARIHARRRDDRCSARLALLESDQRSSDTVELKFRPMFGIAALRLCAAADSSTGAKGPLARRMTLL
jgi:hypothetical protein